jgi:hypothetical protein
MRLNLRLPPKPASVGRQHAPSLAGLTRPRVGDSGSGRSAPGASRRSRGWAVEAPERPTAGAGHWQYQKVTVPLSDNKPHSRALPFARVHGTRAPRPLMLLRPGPSRCAHILSEVAFSRRQPSGSLMEVARGASWWLRRPPGTCTVNGRMLHSRAGRTGHGTQGAYPYAFAKTLSMKRAAQKSFAGAPVVQRSCVRCQRSSVRWQCGSVQSRCNEQTGKTDRKVSAGT